MKEDSLYKMIDRYFDGELTIEEERGLLQELLNHPKGDPEIEEALAVMTAARVVPGSVVRNRRQIWKGIAATVAILVVSGVILSAVGMAIRGSLYGNQDNAIAYVNGVKVSDETKILSIIQGQLEEMSMASEEMNGELASDLDDIFNALNDDEL